MNTRFGFEKLMFTKLKNVGYFLKLVSIIIVNSIVLKKDDVEKVEFFR